MIQRGCNLTLLLPTYLIRKSRKEKLGKIWRESRDNRYAPRDGHSTVLSSPPGIIGLSREKKEVGEGFPGGIASRLRFCTTATWRNRPLTSRPRLDRDEIAYLKAKRRRLLYDFLVRVRTPILPPSPPNDGRLSFLGKLELYDRGILRSFFSLMIAIQPSLRKRNVANTARGSQFRENLS